MASKSDSMHTIVVESKLRSRWLRAVVILPIIAVLAITLASVILYRHDHARNVANANAQELKLLQQNLAVELKNANNPKGVIDTLNTIIGGIDSKTYVVPANSLGQYYENRADAHTQLKEYKQAIPDYQLSRKYNSSLQQASLQGEFFAGYQIGERKQLIPVLQQLVTLESKSDFPLASTLVQQYQGEIQAIQDNQELQL